MYCKYMIIVTEIGSSKPFVTIAEYEDANDAIDAYYDYVEDNRYDVALYRRFKHDYNNI